MLIEVSVENHNILIVLWRWGQVKLITKSISKWADESKIKDSTLRILTIVSLGVFYSFIQSNSALWSYVLVWIFELFVVVYKYKIGRELTLIVLVLSLSPILLLLWVWILWFDSMYEECCLDKQKPVAPIDQVQSYDLESQQPRIFDISSRYAFIRFS